MSCSLLWTLLSNFIEHICSALLFASRPPWEAPGVEQTGLALTGLPTLTAAVRMHVSVCGKARQRFLENCLPVSLASLIPASPIAQR